MVAHVAERIDQLGLDAALLADLARGGLFVGLVAVEVLRLRDLSPRDIEHDNPEFRRHEELVHFLKQIYSRDVTLDDTVTVVRFSAVLEKPAGMSEAMKGFGGAQN